MRRLAEAPKSTRREASSAAQTPLIIAYEQDLEEALHFLVGTLGNRHVRGKKPVVMHSLRVAGILCQFHYPREVIVAGVLHDVLEKTRVSSAVVTRKFGPKVSGLVVAATKNDKIHDPLGRYFESVLRCEAAGKPALLVRAADLIDNCDRLIELGADGRLAKMAVKLRILIQVSKRSGLDPRMVDELLKRYRRIGRRVGSLAAVVKRARATTLKVH